MAKIKGKYRLMFTKEQLAERKKRERRMDSADGPPAYWPQTITFNVDQLPEIIKWEVGDNYEISLKVKMKSFEERRREGKKPKQEARFEILAVKADSELNEEQKKIFDKMV